MKAVVAHPGLQHAHQLAWALEEAGYLTAFWSGVPVVDSRNPRGEGWGLLARRLRAVPIPATKRRHIVAFPLLRRIFGARMFGRVSNAWNHRLDHAFDAWFARHVTRLKPDLVVCYENSALHTFKAARAAGAVCVLDAASVHYGAARQWLTDAGQVNPDWVDIQKDQEIALADAILTCSEFAAATYAAAGVPPERLHAVPVGTALPDVPSGSKEVGGTCRFVFVGSLSRRKGVDVLLDVFEDLAAEGVPARLELIGGVAEHDLAARARTIPNVTLRAHMPQIDLFAEVARHDCLILPSRFDSFGMVVAEAMAVGVPAIVSDRVGAKSIIEQHPGAGWIVPFGRDALKAKVLELVADRRALESAGRAARYAAQFYSWEGYRGRVVETLERVARRYGEATAG